MGDRQEALGYLTQLKRDMLAKREQLLRPVQQLEKELEHIVAAIAIVLEAGKTDAPKPETPNFPIANLRSMSQRDAVIALARHNGGILEAQDAKKMLIQSGCMSNTKNSSNMTHNAIVQSGQFERIGRGVYRLKGGLKVNPITESTQGLEDISRTGLFAAKPVQ